MSDKSFHRRLTRRDFFGLALLLGTTTLAGRAVHALSPVEKYVTSVGKQCHQARQ